MTRNETSAGEIFIERLAQHGVEYLFANGGTDFAPIIEALAHRQAKGVDSPQALVIPHENAAVAMAHGYYLATGRAQAVMVHTNVGLANAVMGAINAATEQIPMLLCSGRTPLTEQGRLGSRSTPINWGQDMRDQAGMIRESVKWDGELRYPEQIIELVDRGFAIANSHPKGPVYLSLPREPLCATFAAGALSPPVMAPVRFAPDPAAIRDAAALLVAAERPLIIAHRNDGGLGEALAEFAGEFALPVVEFWPSRISLASDHPMHAGFEPGDDLAEADVVLVLDALVPWITERHTLRPDAKVIQAGTDPLHARFPVRNFRADLCLAGEAVSVIAALGNEMRGKLAPQAVETRFATLAGRHGARRAGRKAVAEAGAASPMTPEWVSYAVSSALGEDGVIFSELGARQPFLHHSRPGGFFAHAVSGGLGWALPAALGFQLADRERLVAACVGDGSYLFSNPVVCHQIAEALELPLLVILFNNGVWNAVRNSTLAIYPDGDAARANRMPVTQLDPAPDYCKIAEASRAWTARVEDGADLPATLAQAIAVIRNERRQVLLEVRVVAD